MTESDFGPGLIPFPRHFLGNSNKTLGDCTCLPVVQIFTVWIAVLRVPSGATQGPHLSSLVILYK